jgi:ribosomal protein S27E
MKKEVVCPKCHSAQITSKKRGFTFGRIMRRGLLIGATEANKIEITCLMCGAQFFPGRGGVKYTDENGIVTYDNDLLVDIPRQGIVDFYVLGIILLLIILVIALSKFS